MNLSIQQISKTYPNGLKALDQISIDLKPGMFGLLGPNGAGKSSLMRTIATLQLPDHGQIYWNGKDIFQHKIDFRKVLGYLPQDFGVYPKESALQLLDYFAILKGINNKNERKKIIRYVLNMTNLEEVKHKKVSTFSGGMRQRFGIAQLLLNNPKVIIVDEPTAGLDPAERSRFLNVLRNIGKEHIVIFSTHLVEDVRELCQDMAIINKGRVIRQIPPKTAIESLKGNIWQSEKEKEQWNDLSCPVIELSHHFNDANQLTTRIFAERQPANHFIATPVKLEDYYFLTLNQMK